jgi:membrane-associated phospholipid phosphatase
LFTVRQPLMLIAIPIEGSHYLVDVIAGAAVAGAAWAVAAAVVNAGARARLSLQREQQPQQIPVRSFRAAAVSSAKIIPCRS